MQRRNFISSFITGISGNWIAASPATAKTTNPPSSHIPHTFKSEPTSAITRWLSIPQQPVFQPSEILLSDQETASVLFQHIRSGNPISITYHGGTQPGTSRTITPVLLFQKIPKPYTMTEQPHTYLIGHCHLRQTTRTFRLDRIRI